MKSLVKGQKVKLADLTSAMNIEVGLSCTFAPQQDVDISCFGVDDNNTLSDDRYFIFYNQKTSPCGGIVATGSQAGDNERFRIDLSRLPGTIRKLVFTATLEAGTMMQMSQGMLRILVNDSLVMDYRFTGADFGAEKALIVGELYLKDVWRFGAVGQGFNGGLSALLKHFGGEEVAAPPPAPVPSAAPAPAPFPLPTSTPAPPPTPAPSLSKVTLDKKGDKKAVDLRKGGGVQPIHINLNWDSPNTPKRGGFLGFGGSAASATPDLDLGCMFRLANGSIGVIQPLGGNFGAKDSPPFIHLDKDDRSGAASDGENLYIYRPDLIDLVMVFAFIYEGAKDFTAVAGRMRIRDQIGNEIFIQLNNPNSNATFCAICTIQNIGTKIEISKEENYFTGHEDADRYYKFGFRWRAGSK